MPIDEVLSQLEQAVLEAAKQATEVAKGGRMNNINNWANATNTLAEALAKLKSAYSA